MTQDYEVVWSGATWREHRETRIAKHTPETVMNRRHMKLVDTDEQVLIALKAGRADLRQLGRMTGFSRCTLMRVMKRLDDVVDCVVPASSNRGAVYALRRNVA